MKIVFKWEDLDHPILKKLREKYKLEEVVSSGKSEFEKQILLKKWVFETLPLGYNNTNRYKSAMEVLDDRQNTGGFNCTWYVLTLLQCAQSLGWYVRKLGIDTDHAFGEEEMRHTVVDMWSTTYQKWYVVDPMFNVHFKIADGRLLTVLTGMIVAGENRDALNWVIYDLASGDFKDEKLDEKMFQRKVDKKAKRLRKKYMTKGLSEIYDYFEPSLRESSYFSTNGEEFSQPNPLLQKAFMQTVREVKRFNKQIYMRDYIESKAGMKLMSEKDIEKIDSFAKEINEFVGLEGHLALLGMYAEFADKGMLRSDNLSEPGFLKSIKDMRKATRITKKVKEKAEKEIEDALHKHNN